jgi:NAD-dependent DNA ligase
MVMQDRELRYIHNDRLVQRDIDQLLGICEFALQDGHIDQFEAENILIWLNNHRGCINEWPAKILYDRLNTMLADKKLDDDEQGDLLSLVMQIARPPSQSGDIIPTSLPLDNPPPNITIVNHSFCFTGVFDYGSRDACQSAITQRGGSALKNVTKKLNYLVIGNIGSEFWKFSSFGNKIAAAIDLREAGQPIKIISEQHWQKFI